ncbi:hypothetical protein YQE_02403, partial [Dendroctonus ponderosae]
MVPKDKKIDTVTLDSDDEIQMVGPKKSPSGADKSPELIMLFDDDEESKPAKPKRNLNKVLVIDSDSDTETALTKKSITVSDFAEANALFEAFLESVKAKLMGSEFEEVLPKKLAIMKKHFQKSAFHVNEKDFLAMLKETTKTIQNVPNADAANKTVIGFYKVYESLKLYIHSSTIEIEADHLPKVKRLEKIIKLLRKKIKQLDEAEVDFDADENSAYLMCDRYQKKLKKVYAKYCEYIRRNPQNGRAIYDKIQFVHSKCNAINQALSRKYRNSVEFPTYYAVEKCIKKVVTNGKLNLSEQCIKVESEKCFQHLGSILQKKRRQELYDSHLDFIDLTSDPASKDVALANTLKKNYTQGKEKLDQLYQRYVEKQELGEDDVSSEEEQSSSKSDAEDKLTTEETTNILVNDL